MSMTKGFVALLLVAGIFWLLVRRAVPDELEKPQGVTHAGVDRAEEARAEQQAVVPKSSQAGVSSTASEADPLAMLILAKGYACTAVAAAEPIDPAGGIYAITCQTQGRERARYRVNTRVSDVQPILA
jgi:hypothetical protein